MSEEKNDEEFKKRVMIAIERAGGIVAFARTANISRANIDKYLKVGSDPSRTKLISMANAANVSVEWLATGNGVPEKYGQLAEQAQAPYDHTEFAYIPVINCAASGGGGAVIPEDELKGYVAFDKAWLRRHTLELNKLFTMRVSGESMEPTLRAGDYIMCSSAEENLKLNDGIYVIRLNGSILVKRLQVVPEGVLVTSENALYQAFTIPYKNKGDFVVLGKVIFAHKIQWF